MVFAQVEEADLRLNNSGLDASPEDGVEMVIDFLDSLGNVNQLLFCVESIADSLELDADGGARRGGWRRLLASSAAYRMRVRRMLLRKMDGGSASDSVSDVTGPALLSSTSKLQPGPDEVFPRAPNEDSMALLDASTKALRIEQLRDGGLLQALTLVDKLLASSEQMETMDQVRVNKRPNCTHTRGICTGFLVLTARLSVFPGRSCGLWLAGVTAGLRPRSLDAFAARIGADAPDVVLPGHCECDCAADVDRRAALGRAGWRLVDQRPQGRPPRLSFASALSCAPFAGVCICLLHVCAV